MLPITYCVNEYLIPASKLCECSAIAMWSTVFYLKCCLGAGSFSKHS